MSFTHHHVFQNQYNFLSFVEHKEDILRNVRLFFTHTMEVNSNPNCFVTVLNILKNISFYVPQKK